MTFNPFQHGLTLLIAGALALSSNGCFNQGPHSGGIYSVETSALEAVLPDTEKAGLLDPPPPMSDRPVSTTTYLTVKLYEITPDQVTLKYSFQEGELPVTSEGFSDDQFKQFATKSLALSRTDFDTVAPKLTWVADGKTDDWTAPEAEPESKTEPEVKAAPAESTPMPEAVPSSESAPKSRH